MKEKILLWLDVFSQHFGMAKWLQEKYNYEISTIIDVNKGKIFYEEQKFVNFKNKWYFDDLYKIIFVKKILILGNNLWLLVDNGIIDKLGPNGLAKITKKISRFLASFQTGYIYHYAFSLIIGIALLLTFILFFV